jgi:hypothetical protein
MSNLSDIDGWLLSDTLPVHGERHSLETPQRSDSTTNTSTCALASRDETSVSESHGVITLTRERPMRAYRGSARGIDVACLRDKTDRF